MHCTWNAKADVPVCRGRPFPLPHPGDQAPAGRMSPLAVGPQQRPWLSWGSASSKLPRRRRTSPCPAKGRNKNSQEHQYIWKPRLDLSKTGMFKDQTLMVELHRTPPGSKQGMVGGLSTLFLHIHHNITDIGH
ncbi:hypothetical protein HJG60_008574 [Phyllostomus discolor]|uniref:Uncharacterized protein n=1 Tax=Phyllostomus discolor TaxID=89673 RepID=A0A833Z0D1_9CHIR|nr:hypothetical protein HJG60_008574 [Phyllostomus discolor]